MKKYRIIGMLLALALIIPQAVKSADLGGINMSPSAINGMNSLNGGLNVHDVNMIKEQQFRHREYNEYKDMKEQKEARNKKDVIDGEIENTQQINNKIQRSEDAQFIRENGQIRIRHVE